MGILTRLAALAVTIALLPACDFTREAPLLVEGEQIAVYSLLRAGSDTVSVFIVRAPVNTDPGEPPFFPVSGADVRITTPAGETLTLTEAPEIEACFLPERAIVEEFTSSGCYRAAVPGGVRPGGRYTLRVELPGGGEVRGEAVVPERPEILALVDTNPGFAVRFDAPAAAARLQILVRALRENCRVQLGEASTGNLQGGGSSIIITDATRNRVRIVLAEAECEGPEGEPVPVDSLPLGLTLVAYDSAFARYAERVLDPEGAVLTSGVSAGLTGALGVFGGASSDRVRVVLIFRTSRPALMPRRSSAAARLVRALRSYRSKLPNDGSARDGRR